MQTANCNGPQNPKTPKIRNLNLNLKSYLNSKEDKNYVFESDIKKNNNNDHVLIQNHSDE